MQVSPSRFDSGFTLIEVVIALSTLCVAAFALAGVLVSVDHQAAQAAARFQALCEAQVLMEEIKNVPAIDIEATYAGSSRAISALNKPTYSESIVSVWDPITQTDVDQVHVTVTNSAELLVDVDSNDPTLLIVTVNGSWALDGHTESLVLQTSIYNDPSP